MERKNLFERNFPYGVMVNEKGECAMFNREYQPLGQKKQDYLITYKEYVELFSWVKYSSLTLRKLEIITGEPPRIMNHEDTEKQIHKFWFYDDSNNPSNTRKDQHYTRYFKILKQIFSFKIIKTT